MSKKIFKDIGLYLVVGAIATLCEWLLFYLFEGVLSWYYIIATIVAYVISTFVNWFAGRLLVFKRSNKTFYKEIFQIYVASFIGLLLNVLFMWLLVDLLGVWEMLSKMVATAIVFLYNFFVRKLLIYNNK